MSDPVVSDPSNPNPGDKPTPAAPAAPDNASITLTREEYSNLVTQMAMLQAQVERRQEPEVKPQVPAGPTKHFNEMTNEELMQTMVGMLNQQIAQPLLNQITTLALKEEMREVSDKYADFKDMKSDIYKVAEANTHLSLEQAYLIVKAQKAGTAPPVIPPAPKDPPVAPPAGEKPGVSSVTPVTKLSTREAAEQAYKALKYS